MANKSIRVRAKELANAFVTIEEYLDLASTFKEDGHEDPHLVSLFKHLESIRKEAVYVLHTMYLGSITQRGKINE